MDRRAAARAAARALYQCIDQAPTIEQINIAQEHIECFAKRQAAGEWTSAGESAVDLMKATAAE